MSRKGNCWDNAVMESFYHALKVALIYLKKYKTRMGAKRDIFEYIEIFYNRERLHSFRGYHSSEEYEKNDHSCLTNRPFYRGKTILFYMRHRYYLEYFFDEAIRMLDIYIYFCFFC